jgi:hypothetical protein
VAAANGQQLFVLPSSMDGAAPPPPPPPLHGAGEGAPLSLEEEMAQAGLNAFDIQQLRDAGITRELFRIMDDQDFLAEGIDIRSRREVKAKELQAMASSQALAAFVAREVPDISSEGLDIVVQSAPDLMALCAMERGRINRLGLSLPDRKSLLHLIEMERPRICAPLRQVAQLQHLPESVLLALVQQGCRTLADCVQLVKPPGRDFDASMLRLSAADVKVLERATRPALSFTRFSSHWYAAANRTADGLRLVDARPGDGMHDGGTTLRTLQHCGYRPALCSTVPMAVSGNGWRGIPRHQRGQAYYYAEFEMLGDVTVR